MTEVIIALGTY